MDMNGQLSFGAANCCGNQEQGWGNSRRSHLSVLLALETDSRLKPLFNGFYS